MNYYLVEEGEKKAQLLTLLRVYAVARDVESLASSLNLLLEGPIQRRLVPAVRCVCEQVCVCVCVNFPELPQRVSPAKTQSKV